MPTNATKTNGSRHTIELIGKNFGTDVLTSSFRIYIGEEESNNNIAVIEKGSEILVHDHRKIVFYAPPGQGKNLRVVVEVGQGQNTNQNSTDNIVLNYLPPSITNGAVAVRGPTDGCNGIAGWEPLITWATRIDGVSVEDLSKDLKIYKRRCNAPFLIHLEGENFGSNLNALSAKVVSSDGKIDSLNFLPFAI